MRLVVHNYLGGASATGRAVFAKTLKVQTNDADFADYGAWGKAVFAKYPVAKIKEEKLSGPAGGTAKVAYADNKVIGKYVRTSGWVASDRKTSDCGGDESCDCGCHSHDAQPEDYFIRVDAHLKTLSDPGAKKKFLRSAGA